MIGTLSNHILHELRTFTFFVIMHFNALTLSRAFTVFNTERQQNEHLSITSFNTVYMYIFQFQLLMVTSPQATVQYLIVLWSKVVDHTCEMQTGNT